LWYYVTHAEHYQNASSMPRVPKQVLPPLKLSSESVGQRIARIRKLIGLKDLDDSNAIPSVRRHAILTPWRH